MAITRLTVIESSRLQVVDRCLGYAIQSPPEAWNNPMTSTVLEYTYAKPRVQMHMHEHMRIHIHTHVHTEQAALLMIQILHDLIHIILPEFLRFWYMKACRLSIINTTKVLFWQLLEMPGCSSGGGLGGCTRSGCGADLRSYTRNP